MAHSPSPQPGALAHSSAGLQFTRNSPTPPLPTVVSKRDKRRLATQDRLQAISQDFASNRDNQYRLQLQALQLDINFINRANPYQNKPLDETSDHLVVEVVNGMVNNGDFRAGSMQAQAQAGPVAARAAELTTQPGIGKWASQFNAEVNDAMEDRDAELTRLASEHRSKIQSIYEDEQFEIEIAEEEHRILIQTVGERLLQQLHQRKKAMIKDKDHVDNNESNSALFNTNLFSMTIPASPAGAQNNRKTRHTRHRLEPDENGDNKGRKRKAQVDPDESPGPSFPRVEPEFNSQYHKHQDIPHYTMGHLFTEKELNINTRYIVHTIVGRWAKKRAKLFHTSGPHSRIGINGSGSLTNGDVSEAEDGQNGTVHDHDPNDNESDMNPSTLVAPEMDRGVNTNQSYHATRSTRNNAAATTTNPLLTTMEPNGTSTPSDLLPPDLKGRNCAIRAIGPQLKNVRTKDDENWPAALSDAEAEADLAAIDAAIALDDESASAGISAGSSYNATFVEALTRPRYLGDIAGLTSGGGGGGGGGGGAEIHMTNGIGNGIMSGEEITASSRLLPLMGFSDAFHHDGAATTDRIEAQRTVGALGTANATAPASAAFAAIGGGVAMSRAGTNSSLPGPGRGALSSSSAAMKRSASGVSATGRSSKRGS